MALHAKREANMNRAWILWTLAGAALAAIGSSTDVDSAEDDAPATRKATKIVLLAGRPSHGRDTHAWDADGRLLKHCLDHSPNVPGLRTELHVNGWPKDPATLDDADTIVLLSDGFAAHPFFRSKDRVRTVSRLMARGKGLVCIHYAVAALPPWEDTLTEWIGGIYKRGYSRNPVNTAEVAPASSDHAICRGWKAFTAKDEFYYRIWFRREKRAVPIMTMSLPKSGLQGEVIAWAVERKDGGRGFGFTGGHFHRNWRIEPFRKMVLNAVVWTAKRPVPEGGVQSSVPERSFLQPKPRRKSP